MSHGKENPNWKGGPVQKICAHCGIEFTVVRAREKTAKYCGRSCSGKVASAIGHAIKATIATYHWRKEKKRVWPAPQIVGLHTRLGIARNCGHLTRKGRLWCYKCAPVRGDTNRTCVFCGSQFEVAHPSTRRKTCSEECKRLHWSAHQKGEKSHRWRGGKTEENRLLRKGIKYTMWRESVFQRDNFTCVFCGQKGGRLTADHIKPWALYPHIRFDPNNGRTLCRPCHQKLPTTGGSLVAAMNSERKKHGGIQLGLL